MPRRMRALAAALSSRRRFARCSSFWSCASCDQLSASDLHRGPRANFQMQDNQTITLLTERIHPVSYHVHTIATALSRCQFMAFLQRRWGHQGSKGHCAGQMWPVAHGDMKEFTSSLAAAQMCRIQNAKP